MNDLSYIVFTVVITALVTSLIWLLTVKDQYDEAEKEAWEFHDKHTKKQIAGHKAAHTFAKKNLVVAKVLYKNKNKLTYSKDEGKDEN